MKYLAVLFALIAAVTAQTAGLPSCAQSCALNSIGSTGCAVTDAKCICTNNAWLSSIETCISTSCSAADQTSTLQFAEQYCGAVGVTITPPSPSSGSISTTSSSPPVSTETSSTEVPESPTTTSSSVPVPAVPTLAGNASGVGNATLTTPPPSAFTGAAALLRGSWVAAALGAVLVAAL